MQRFMDGEIAAVGLKLYTHLLRDAVTRLQGSPVLESPAQVTVSLPLAAFLPTDHVSDERLRLATTSLPGGARWEDVLVRALRELGRLERIRQRAASQRMGGAATAQVRGGAETGGGPPVESPRRPGDSSLPWGCFPCRRRQA